MTIESLMLILAALLGLSVVASKASGALGVPALVLFLFVGMLAGSDGLGGIYFDDARVAQAVGVVALAFILFSGGLDTPWQRVRPIIARGLAMSTLGVFLTAVFVGVFAAVVLGISLAQGLLIGAIVSSTDAAAVFSLLRARSVRLVGDLEPLLEFESGSNDPMAVFLVLGMLQLLSEPGASIFGLAPLFLQQMVLGAAAGYLLGRAAVFTMNRLRLQTDGLYSVATITLVLLAYSATALLGGNGFLAVYIAGLVMGNSDFIHKRSLARFHDGLAWLMQIVMFLTLGLLVFPSQLAPVAGSALLMALFLMFVARPAATFLVLGWTRMRARELVLVSWVGLRGAVPIILATFPLLAGLPGANTIFNLVFFVVLTSVLIQGTTATLVGRWLGLNRTLPVEAEGSSMLTLEGAGTRLSEVRISAASPAAGKQIVDLHLPERVLVVLLNRRGEQTIPTGSTVIEAGDVLTLLANEGDLEATRRRILCLDGAGADQAV